MKVDVVELRKSLKGLAEHPDKNARRAARMWMAALGGLLLLDGASDQERLSSKVEELIRAGHDAWLAFLESRIETAKSNSRRKMPFAGVSMQADFQIEELHMKLHSIRSALRSSVGVTEDRQPQSRDLEEPQFHAPTNGLQA